VLDALGHRDDLDDRAIGARRKGEERHEAAQEGEAGHGGTSEEGSEAG